MKKNSSFLFLLLIILINFCLLSARSEYSNNYENNDVYSANKYEN